MDDEVERSLSPAPSLGRLPLPSEYAGLVAGASASLAAAAPFHLTRPRTSTTPPIATPAERAKERKKAERKRQRAARRATRKAS
ncbi:MAG: hypothetical protein KAG89_02375 [Fulvimarina manganoxydans]|uniref:hypothetical protein n=1 Tax=Fulvimarina manganoxydans TaxID=937218 RepID=UPI002352D4AA|nr:hypothetical protein [Fulvimarina manganoxydans]MCK5930990.1 hypothetical protein [Fulvimarina manganoxydans]